ncbi:MAG: hypothetical protein UW04_C0011G0014 [Parcubacteria group bacterium GW2011_GWB1_43_8]|nr:MAG: hypothetical protein UW04_C0011G0014 [Parcubacteria group bacterium GW2011_GWB1_43_8]
MDIVKKLFVLPWFLVFIFCFSTVVLARGASESLFAPVNKPNSEPKPEYASPPETWSIKVKVFEYESGYKDSLKDFEIKINNFLSQKNIVIKQIFQTSAGAGGTGSMSIKVYTIVTIFYSISLYSY